MEWSGWWSRCWERAFKWKESKLTVGSGSKGGMSGKDTMMEWKVESGEMWSRERSGWKCGVGDGKVIA